DMTGRRHVVIGSSFVTRSRNETRGIAGLFTNLAPLVIAYDPRLAFSDWVASVRDRLFETEAHAELSIEEVYAELRASGLEPPGIQILFSMSSDWSPQRVAGLTLARRPHPVAEMPWGCQFLIDQRSPESCRVEFDAGLYDRADMQAMVD